MKYEEMLERALEKLPKKVEERKRFEMPRVISEVQGSKTILKNLNEILSILRRDVKHFTKFISKELATAASLEGSYLVFQGRISREILQKKVEEYVKEFVLCKECKQPDTKIVKEGRISFLKCEACGAKYSVRSK